jgi:hypothetical protein
MCLKIISITLFRDLVAAFRKPPLTINMLLEAVCGVLKIVLKAAYDMKFCVHFSCILVGCRVDTGEHPPMTEKESRNSSIAAFGTFLE